MRKLVLLAASATAIDRDRRAARARIGNRGDGQDHRRKEFKMTPSATSVRGRAR